MLELVVVAALIAPPAREAKVVPWAEVRADIGETVCVMVDKLPDGKEAFGSIAGDRKTCTGSEGRTPLARAVDKVLGDARLLLTSIPAGAVKFEYKQGRPAEENTRALREAYLASDDFLRPILSRLPAALAAESLACRDFPTLEAKEIRQVSWTEFLPYLTAHVWPDRVRTPVGPDGKATGMPDYSFHICVGLNGVSEMKDPDPLLVRAGFLTAMELEVIREKAGAYFQDVLNEEAYQRLADDGARTVYLRKHLGLALAGDAAVKTGACEVLARRSSELSLRVSGCEPSKAPGS
jgi:hypothetical protein